MQAPGWQLTPLHTPFVCCQAVLSHLPCTSAYLVSLASLSLSSPFPILHPPSPQLAACGVCRKGVVRPQLDCAIGMLYHPPSSIHLPPPTYSTSLLPYHPRPSHLPPGLVGLGVRLDEVVRAPLDQLTGMLPCLSLSFSPAPTSRWAWCAP